VGAGGKLGGVQWGIAADQDNVYVAVSDVRYSVVPRGTPGAQASVLNPKISFLFDSNTGGGISALGSIPEKWFGALPIPAAAMSRGAIQPNPPQ
jgi:hypothetical protein